MIKIKKSTSNYNFYGVENEGVVQIPGDMIDVNSVKDLKSYWGPGLHLAAFYKPNQLNENSVNDITNDLIKLAPFFR